MLLFFTMLWVAKLLMLVCLIVIFELIQCPTNIYCNQCFLPYKISKFRIKELKDVLHELGLPRQGKKQELLDRLESVLCHQQDQDTKMSGVQNRTLIRSERLVKAVEDTFRKMQDSTNTVAALRSHIDSGHSAKSKEKSDDSPKLDAICSCPCGNSIPNDPMIKCNIWQHASSVIIPEKPADNSAPELPSCFCCEMCRINRVDPSYMMQYTAESFMLSIGHKQEVMRQKKQNGKKQNEQVELVVATLEPSLESLKPLTGETLSSEVGGEVSGIKRQGNQVATATPLFEVEEAGGKQEKKRKRRNHGEEAAPPSHCAIVGSPIWEGDYKTAGVVVPVPAQGAKKCYLVKKQNQSGSLALAFDGHLQGVEEVSDCPRYENVTIRCGSSSSSSENMRMRVKARRQQPVPRGLSAAIAGATNSSYDCIEQSPNHSSSVSTFLNQFCYVPDSRQNLNPSPFPQTPDHLARPLSRHNSSPEPPELNANKTSKAAKTTALKISAPPSQEKLQAKHKEKLRMKMDGKKMKYLNSEMFSDKNRHLPLDQPVPEPRCPHKLLQDKKCYSVKRQKQSGSSPLAFDGHPQGGEEVSDRPRYENVTVRSGSSITNNPSIPSSSENMRMRIEARKQQLVPQGLSAAMAEAANSSYDCIEQNPNRSSPVSAFLNQFCYVPVSRQKLKPSPFPETPDHLARPLSRHNSSHEPPELNANKTSKTARTTALNMSASPSQEKLQAKHKGKLRRKMDGKKMKYLKDEMLSDKYRRLPLDQLVPAPRSPHELLQEKYASDPWKVIVICMLLNLTQGKQVRKMVEGFFTRYPDPQAACLADTAKMKEYLAPLGLQSSKTSRIQKFSKQYLDNEWTHITQLCGVGKYAADAYAIFCAGKATEVKPEDHKLIDYWNYVCFKLPFIQASEKSQASNE